MNDQDDIDDYSHSTTNSRSSSSGGSSSSSSSDCTGPDNHNRDNKNGCDHSSYNNSDDDSTTSSSGSDLSRRCRRYRRQRFSDVDNESCGSSEHEYFLPLTICNRVFELVWPEAYLWQEGQRTVGGSNAKARFDSHQLLQFVLRHGFFSLEALGVLAFQEEKWCKLSCQNIFDHETREANFWCIGAYCHLLTNSSENTAPEQTWDDFCRDIHQVGSMEKMAQLRHQLFGKSQLPFPSWLDFHVDLYTFWSNLITTTTKQELPPEPLSLMKLKVSIPSLPPANYPTDYAATPSTVTVPRALQHVLAETKKSNPNLQELSFRFQQLPYNTEVGRNEALATFASCLQTISQALSIETTTATHTTTQPQFQCQLRQLTFSALPVTPSLEQDFFKAIFCLGAHIQTLDIQFHFDTRDHYAPSCPAFFWDHTTTNINVGNHTTTTNSCRLNLYEWTMPDAATWYRFWMAVSRHLSKLQSFVLGTAVPTGASLDTYWRQAINPLLPVSMLRCLKRLVLGPCLPQQQHRAMPLDITQHLVTLFQNNNNNGGGLEYLEVEGSFHDAAMHIYVQEPAYRVDLYRIWESLQPQHTINYAAAAAEPITTTTATNTSNATSRGKNNLKVLILRGVDFVQESIQSNFQHKSVPQAFLEFVKGSSTNYNKEANKCSTTTTATTTTATNNDTNSSNSSLRVLELCDNHTMYTILPKTSWRLTAFQDMVYQDYTAASQLDFIITLNNFGRDKMANGSNLTTVKDVVEVLIRVQSEMTLTHQDTAEIRKVLSILFGLLRESSSIWCNKATTKTARKAGSDGDHDATHNDGSGKVSGRSVSKRLRME